MSGNCFNVYPYKFNKTIFFFFLLGGGVVKPLRDVFFTRKRINGKWSKILLKELYTEAIFK